MSSVGYLSSRTLHLHEPFLPVIDAVRVTLPLALPQLEILYEAAFPMPTCPPRHVLTAELSSFTLYAPSDPVNH